MGQNGVEERPVGELVKDLSTHVSTLVRDEIELAKVEMAAKGKEAGVGAGMFGGAAVMGLYGLGALTAFAILLLATAVDAWLAALIVAVVWFAVAGVLAMVGKGRVKKAVPPAPERTIDSVKRDVQVTKDSIAGARS